MTTGAPHDYDPGSVDPRLYEHLGDYPRELFSEQFYRSCEAIDRYVVEWTLELGRELDLAAALAQWSEPAAVLARRGWAPSFLPALAWLLERLAAAQAIERERSPRDGTTRYRCSAPLPAARRHTLRELVLALDPANAATLDLLDVAAGAYRPVASGETSGEEALFGRGQAELWRRYFDNANPLYAINNRIAALAAADRLSPGGFSVLEIGAGGASATAALLEALRDRGRLSELRRYRVTELSPFLRRHGERSLRRDWPDLPLELATLDIDRPWYEQGIAPGSYQLVFGVNVLHVAIDLLATLRQAHHALAPGGWLVAGECVRAWPGQPVYVELVFQLLTGFTRVRTDPERRPTHGFLTPEQWRRSLLDAGFATVQVSPEVERIREIYARFSTAAICGRRGRGAAGAAAGPAAEA
jgi:SAM-dependent methyltransferase